jgi:hypothetical protein
MLISRPRIGLGAAPESRSPAVSSTASRKQASNFVKMRDKRVTSSATSCGWRRQWPLPWLSCGPSRAETVVQSHRVFSSVQKSGFLLLNQAWNHGNGEFSQRP